MLSKFTSLKNITLQFKRPYVGLMGAPSNYHFSSMKASYLNLKIKTKFTNNPRINPLFKSASTDGYVSCLIPFVSVYTHIFLWTQFSCSSFVSDF